MGGDHGGDRGDLSPPIISLGGTRYILSPPKYQVFLAIKLSLNKLYSYMTQERLNHLMMAEIHKELLMAMDPIIIAKKFIDKNPDARRKVFGNIH